MCARVLGFVSGELSNIFWRKAQAIASFDFFFSNGGGVQLRGGGEQIKGQIYSQKFICSQDEYMHEKPCHKYVLHGVM